MSDTRPCSTRPEWNVNGLKIINKKMGKHTEHLRLGLYCKLHTLQWRACMQRGKYSTVNSCASALFAERHCASRPQAGEHPSGSRSERKGKLDKMYTS